MTHPKTLTTLRWPLAAFVVAVIAACSNDQPAPTVQAPSAESTPVEAAGPAVATVDVNKPTLFELSQLTPDSPISSCHIDSMTSGGATATPGKPFPVSRGSALNVAGWVGTSDENAVPSEVAFRLLAADQAGKVWEFKAPTGGDRSDVASFKGKPALATSGFAFPLDVSSLTPGSYHVYLAFEHEGKAYSCNGGDQILVE